MGFMEKIFGTHSERELKLINKTIDKNTNNNVYNLDIYKKYNLDLCKLNTLFQETSMLIHKNNLILHFL